MVSSNPAGTTTILFTDLVGSTRLLETAGDEEGQRIIGAHQAALQQVITANRGQEVKSLGDGLMAVFFSALDALDCAVAMQQEVRRRNQARPAVAALLIRVGLHVGEPVRDRGDFFGRPVVIAKRLCDQAEGGQIIVSDLVRGLAGSRRRHHFQDLGQLSLKGLAGPLPAFELLWEPLDEESPLPPPTEAEIAIPLPPYFAEGERAVFVGRELELAQLGAAWGRAREGRRHVTLVGGEAGIGKTRLALEFARGGHAAGARVLYGRCQEETVLPYRPFVEALRHYVACCPLAELQALDRGLALDVAGLFPDLRQRLPSLFQSGPGQQEVAEFRLFDAITALLAAASAPRPLILVLDDLQWADRATLQLLMHVVRAPGLSSLFVLAVYRVAEVPRAHPLSRALADLRREHDVHRILLAGLSETDVARLIDAWAQQDAPADFIHAVYEQTEGNPFFIEEVLRHLVESGAIYRDGERWMSDLTVDEMRIPESVKEVIGRRLDRLSDECNSILTIAAVIGREFDLDGLERASDLPVERLLDLLEEALEARVLVEVAHSIGRYSFSHNLIHEALYEQLTTTRRVRLHGQTLQYASSDGIRLAYEVLGMEGPVVVAVGLTNCPAVRPGNRYVAKHWERMSRFSRVILYDRRGVGFSSVPEGGYSLKACLDDLRALLDAVRARRVFLWGATDGGPLAIAFAVQHSERVAGMILAGTTPLLYGANDFAFGINPAVVASFEQVDEPGRGVVQLAATRQGTEAAENIGEVIRRVPPRVWTQMAVAIGSADARPLLSRVTAPTLIIHDRANAYIPVQAAYYLHEHIPGSQLEVSEEYGARVYGEGLYHRIEAFMEEVAASGRLAPGYSDELPSAGRDPVR